MEAAESQEKTSNQIYLKFLVHENDGENSVTRAKGKGR